MNWIGTYKYLHPQGEPLTGTVPSDSVLRLSIEQNKTKDTWQVVAIVSHAVAAGGGIPVSGQCDHNEAVNLCRSLSDALWFHNGN